MFSASDDCYSSRAYQDRNLGDVNWDIDYRLDDEEDEDEEDDDDGWYDGNPPDEYWWGKDDE